MTAEAVPQDPTNHNRVNILLVDDEVGGLIALEAVLQSDEYSFLKARSGQEALKLLLDNDFGLILMDVHMPGLTGFETAEIIKTREQSRYIPIIFVTGSTDDIQQVYQGYQAGAVDYMIKPLDVNILKSKVAVFIDLFIKNRTIQRQAEMLRETERAKLELESLKRYRTLSDTTPNIVWEAHPAGDLEYFNKSWYDYTQLSVEESKGIGWHSAIEPEDLSELLALWKSKVPIGEPFDIECRIRRGSDQSYRWHLIRIVPEKTESGTLNRWFGTGTDIHDHKKAEEELRRANRSALEAVQVKSDFLATMSHEIRTPLNAVLGMAHLLAETPQTDEQKDYTGTIQRAGETLLNLINDILDFSKIESGKMELEILNFNLRNLIDDCKKSFSFMAKKKGIKFVTHVSSEIPLDFKGDSGRLQQILWNLINNAIKFTSMGEVSLNVTVSDKNLNTSDRVNLRFEIKDTGIGIPEAAMSRMFQSFSQANSSTTRRFGGTGLGLSISKRLVELMGGKIGVTSEENKGSTFWFTLDLEKGNPSSAAFKNEEKVLPRSTEGRILVAEDNVINQKVVLRALEKLGYRAEAVANGNEVLDVLREIPYDIILMDWQMPDMDGIEATKVIRASRTLGCSDIPIIAMTANAMKGDHEKCIEAGMNDYLSKPLDFHLLDEKLQSWLSKSQVKNLRSNPGC